MKKILTAIAAFLLCNAAFAQIDPTVEVSRQYKVNIADIDRPIETDLRVADSLQRFDVDFDYSIFNRPYTDLYEFTPYQTDSISKVTRRRPPRVMAQIGCQWPLAPEFLLKSQLVTRPRLNIGLDADARAAAFDADYLGESDALNTVRFNGGLSGSLKHAWRTGELTLGLGYKVGGNRDTYHENYLDHIVNSYYVDFNLASANPVENSVFYSVNFNYASAAKALNGAAVMDTTFNNSRMSLKGTLGSSFDKHRVYVNMVYQTAIAGKGENKYNVGLLEFMPVYEYAQGRFKARVGARFGNNYIGTEAATTIHPEADIKFEVLKNTIWLRGIVSGGNQLNSMVDYIHDAPWLCNGFADTPEAIDKAIAKRNLETKIAIESIIAGRLAVSPFIAYNNYTNWMQMRTELTPAMLPILLPEYCDYGVTQLGVETSWKSKNLTVTGNLVHNNAFNETETDVYMVPEWMLDASMEFNVKRRFFINAAYTYQSSRLSWGGEIPDYSDLSVVLTGVLNRHFSVYVKGGNLLNHMNYRYLAILEMPLNIGGGVRINF